jgi:2-polyprenyl-3-methyl-5-hydroxy-6-metoxy-1,4-benzoquinol methylase
MAKDIRLESFKYHFLMGVEKLEFSDQPKMRKFLEHLEFDRAKKGVIIRWEGPVAGELEFPFSEFTFYKKGDTARSVEKQENEGLVFSADTVYKANRENTLNAILRVVEMSELKISKVEDERLKIEEDFHDDWADSEDLNKIDVRLINEAVTAPEMRYIHKKLGDIRGKTLLDVGCGLGEASAYFALSGADVTATDLSSGMLRVTTELAELNGTSVKTHKASAEGLDIPEGMLFDIVYTGNLLHHVDVEKTLLQMKKVLKPGGTLVTWDPLHYNPAINNYRKKAMDVRTPDEHPLKWADLKLFNKHFAKVERKYFWLSSLFIFVIMAIVQRRDPNKERYWKSVISESKKWAPMYWPLAALDSVLLFFVPPLRLLCWNVVVFAKK